MGESKRVKTAKSIISEKYSEEFSVIETRELSESSFYAWMSPADRPDIVFRAEITNDGSWSTDDYIVKILCHEITDRAEYEMRDYPGEYFVFTKNILEYTLDGAKDTTVEKHLENNPGDRFDIVIFTEKKNTDVPALYEAAGRIKRNIGCSQGSVNVIAIEGSLADIQNQVEQYDDLKSDDVQTAVSGGNKVLISLETTESMPAYEEFRKAIEK